MTFPYDAMAASDPVSKDAIYIDFILFLAMFGAISLSLWIGIGVHKLIVWLRDRYFWLRWFSRN